MAAEGKAWWEEAADGWPIPVGIVSVACPDTGAAPGSPAECLVHPVEARWTAGVEYAARAFDAAQPVDWDGGTAFLFVTAPTATDLPRRTLQVAKALWQRARIELGLAAHIGVHVADLGWSTAQRRLGHAEVVLCRRLQEAAAPGTIAVSEDVYLALSADERPTLSPLGIAAGTSTPAYGFPTGAAAAAGTTGFTDDPDLPWWQAFRDYAQCPEVRRLRYVGFRQTRKEPPSLDVRDVFVCPDAALRVRDLPRSASDAAGASSEIGAPPVSMLERERPGPGAAQSIRQLLTAHRILVVLGDPGSGKSTLVRWLAVTAAAGRITLGREFGIPERLLPLPVSVGRLAEVRDTYGRPCSVDEALARYFQECNVGPEADLLPFLHRRLASGDCLVLLDGLDEVRASEREAIRGWLESFAVHARRNRYVVTSRLVGYASLSLPSAQEVVLQRLSADQVEQYVKAFHRAYLCWEMGRPATVEADQRANDLLASIKSSPRLAALAGNPFLLSALALIHRAEGTLPRHRVQAYETFARALCETWAGARRLVHGAISRDLPYEDEALPVLGDLALAMHERYPAGVAPERFVVETLAEAVGTRAGLDRVEAERAARKFLERAGQETQILLERGAGAWGFLHLTFQEFFAAAGLHAQERFEEVAWSHLFDPRWEEVLRLGVGYQALIQKRPEAARRFVKRVLKEAACPQHPWIVDVLQKQIPLTALLAAEAGDALPRPLQTQIAQALLKWGNDCGLWKAGERVLTEVAGTELARVVGDLVLRALERAEGNQGLAIDVLGWLREDRAAGHLERIVRGATPGPRCAAMKALRRIKPAGFKELVLSAVRDADWSVAHEAVEAIGEMRLPEGIGPLIEAEGKDRSSTEITVVGLAALSVLGRYDRRHLLAPALAALDSANPAARAGAAYVLGFIKPPGALPKLLKYLRDPDPHVRTQVSSAVGCLADDSALDVLVAALTDPDPAIRGSTAAGLHRWQGLFATIALVKAVEVAEPAARAEAARALSERVGGEAKDATLKALLNPDPATRARALAAVLETQEARTRQAAEDDGEEPPWHVRVAEYLYLEGDPPPEEVLRIVYERLNDPDPKVRGGTAGSLGMAAARETVQPLLHALKDRDLFVRYKAIQSLGALGADVPVEPLLDYVLPSAETWPLHFRSVSNAARTALWEIANKLSFSAPDPPDSPQS